MNDLKTLIPVIQAEVARQVALKPPRDGRDGRDGKSIKGDAGEPGPPLPMELVHSIITEAVQLRVARIPIPKDGLNGINGRDGRNGADAMPMVPAIAFFDREPFSRKTLRVRVIADAGEIEITPTRNEDGDIEQARIVRVA